MISIISPVYNSEACLDKLVFKIFQSTKKNFKKIEIVLVDDGSKDNSWKKIKSLKKKYRFIKGIKQKKILVNMKQFSQVLKRVLLVLL